MLPPCPNDRPIPAITIVLGESLSDPFNRSLSLAIAEQLSKQRGHHVGILDLQGFVLMIWTDDQINSASPHECETCGTQTHLIQSLLVAPDSIANIHPSKTTIDLAQFRESSSAA